MWFLAIAMGVAALVVVVTRGSWSRLFHLPMQGSLFFVAGLLLQAALQIVTFAPDRIETTGFALLMLSYVFLLTFCLINLPLRGMGLIALGIALNVVVIGLNQGMPTRAVGLDSQGNLYVAEVTGTYGIRAKRTGPEVAAHQIQKFVRA